MAISLLHLEQGWFEHPLGRSRAPGGRRSLMGFSYQLSLSLERFFDQVLAGKSDAQMAFEGLGDLTEVREDLVFLTQVKSTLSKPSIRDAVKEALAVDQYLDEMHSELRSKFRYQICGRSFKRGTIIDPQNFSADDLELDTSQATRWNQLRPRLLPVVIRGNPDLELVIKLFRTIPNTFEFVDALIGELVRLLGQNQPSNKICAALLARWDTHREIEDVHGVLLKPSDFLDQSGGKDYILVGDRPRLENLRDGCFMDRPLLVQTILGSLRSLLHRETLPQTKAIPERKIPVFWIGAASGAGTSVLLLQTLQALITEGDSVVHFLAHFSHQLPAALTYWSRQSKPVVIAVDDLFAPENRSPDVWREVYSLACQAPWKVYPAILTCGPDDYRQAFEEEARRGGGLRVIPMNIPNLDVEEQQQYHQWYCGRVNQEVAPVREPVFVVAAFTLELKRGGDANIAEFAQRFADRLRSWDLTQEVLAALAFNMLGLSVPRALFIGKEDPLSQLLQEEVFRISTTSLQQDFVRLFQPKIAKAIYDTLVPVSQTFNRADHLRRSFEAIIDHSERANAFLKQLAKARVRRQLSDGVVLETLRQVWRVLARQQVPTVDIGLVRAWKESATKLTLPLEPLRVTDRIKEWMADAAMNARGWGSLWRILWDVAQPVAKDGLAADALAWLEEHADLPEWSFVWSKLWKHKTGDEHLKQLAVDWLSGNSDNPGWSFVYQALFDAGIREERMVDIGLSGLATSPVTVADPFIWKKVAVLNPDPYVFINYVTKRLCKANTVKIREEGAELIASRLSEVGIRTVIKALNLSVDELGWAYFYQVLWDRLARDPSAIQDPLVEVGRSWLVGREERPEWAFIWQRLVEQLPGDTELLAQGRAWLVGREERPEWAFVWRRLLDQLPEDTELLAQGRSWLTGREERSEWAFVKRKLDSMGH